MKSWPPPEGWILLDSGLLNLLHESLFKHLYTHQSPPLGSNHTQLLSGLD